MNTKPKKLLSIDELESYPGFENFTDEMAEETIGALKLYQFCFMNTIKRRFSKMKN